MPTENEMDPGKSGGENLNQPNSNSSSGNGADSSSTTGLDFGALAGNPDFQKFVGEVVAKTVQSTKDRRFAKLENQVSDNQDQIAGIAKSYQKYIDAGKSPDEALREMQIDQMLAAAKPEPTQVQNQNPGGAGNPGLNFAEVQRSMLAVAGIDENDQGVISFMSGDQFSGTEQEKVNKLAKFIQSRNQPSGEGVDFQPSGSRSGGQSITDEDKLSAKIQGLMKNPTANYAEIQKLAAELQSLSQKDK